MSKALDLVRLLINGANEYEKETGNKNPTVYLSRNNLLVIEKALLKAQEPKQYVDELKLVEKKLKSLDLLMQELDCKDFADLRKYARCGYQTFRNAKGANYDNIIIDEAVIPSEAIIEKSLKALEIIKEKRVACDLLTNPDVMDYKKYNYHCDKYDFIVPLTEEEFNLLKEILRC